MLTVLFDLDGVILDTEKQYTTFWTEIGHRYFPEDTHFAANIKGRVLNDICKVYFAPLGVDEEVRRALHSFEASMNYPFVPGARDFVLKLQSLSVKTAVVTSSDTKKMDDVYRSIPQFPNWFTRILKAEDFTRPKPYPDCYLQGAAALQANLANCVVFEDSLNGLKAARAAGMFVVGVSTTLSVEEVSRHAHWVIPDFRDLTLEQLEEAKARYGSKEI